MSYHYLLVCHDPFEEEEIKFILKWIETRQITRNGTISWKDLIHEVEIRFGKLHSENKFKNYWYSRKRRLATRNQISTAVPAFDSQVVPPIHPPAVLEPEPYPPQFNIPYKMNPIF